MRTAILIDSGCDVSQALVQRYHMKVMHLHIIYPERDYIDGVDILPETIYQRFPGEIPATSTPSPQDVKDMVEEIKAEGYTHVLAFCISSGLSGTGHQEYLLWSRYPGRVGCHAAGRRQRL